MVTVILRLVCVMASYLTTPKKPLSDVCRVCGSPFSKDKKNKVFLFRGTAGLHTALQEATGRSVAEDDGLPPYVCTTCRNKLLKFLRLQRELHETRMWVVETSHQTAQTCRYKRMLRVSPGSPSVQQVSKRADHTASPCSAASSPIDRRRYWRLLIKCELHPGVLVRIKAPTLTVYCSASMSSRAARSLFVCQSTTDVEPSGIEPLSGADDGSGFTPPLAAVPTRSPSVDERTGMASGSSSLL